EVRRGEAVDRVAEGRRTAGRRVLVDRRRQIPAERAVVVHLLDGDADHLRLNVPVVVGDLDREAVAAVEVAVRRVRPATRAVDRRRTVVRTGHDDEVRRGEAIRRVAERGGTAGRTIFGDRRAQIAAEDARVIHRCDGDVDYL